MRSSFFASSVLVAFLLACSSSSPDEQPAAAPPPDAPPAVSPDPTKPDTRQPQRDASIFQNLDFEKLDASGAPVGWSCGCGAQATACKVDDKNAKHGKNALVLGAGCYAMQTASKFDATRSVRFDYFASGAHAYKPDVSIFGAFDEEKLLSSEVAASKSWTPVASDGVLRTDGMKKLTLLLMNSNGAEDGAAGEGPEIHIDDMIAVQDAPNPEAQSGSLLFAHHIDEYGLRSGATPASLFTPLPLDYASQVPLYVELTVEPASAVASIEYVAENEHDWGAIVHFAPGASAPTLRLVWDSVVLVRATPHAEIPQVYTKVADPTQWTQPSAIAESDYAPLVTTAQGLAPADASAEDKMKAVIAWTSSHIGGNGQLTGLDAKTVYDTRVSSCTGYANTAMAMGRVLGVPGRHVVNVLVGMSQQMHSINEFWLGEDLGWRRVEPQSPSPFVPDDYGFIVRLVLPTDEVGDTGGFSGVPLNEFIEMREGASRFGAAAEPSTPFFDCSMCMNRADRQSVLRGTPGDMAQLLATARAKWQADRAQYLAGGLSATRMDARRKALQAKTAQDVAAILAALP
jgi:hypothetical protein